MCGTRGASSVGKLSRVEYPMIPVFDDVQFFLEPPTDKLYIIFRSRHMPRNIFSNELKLLLSETS